MSELVIAQWCVYENPTDYPGKLVARKWEIRRGVPDPIPTAEVIVAETLYALRKQLPPGLYRIPRMPGDDAKILEVWT